MSQSQFASAGNVAGGGAGAVGTIEVRWIDLDAHRASLLAGAVCLSVQELAKAERMAERLLRERYVAAHVFLRSALAERLTCRPGEVRFRVSRWGKPVLEAGDGSLQFNLAHSAGRAIVAFGPGGRIGVDLERGRRSFPWPEIRDRILSPSERADLGEAAGGNPTTLCQVWARKEAVAKATGKGLTIGLGALQVGVDMAPGWRMVNVPGGMNPFWLMDLPFASPWFGALAVERLPDSSTAPGIQFRESVPGANIHG